MRSAKMRSTAYGRALVMPYLAGLSALLLLPGAQAAPPANPRPADRQIARSTAMLLKQQHFSQHPLDDEIARAAFDIIIRRFDSGKLYFLEQDVADFRKEQDALDEQFAAGDIGFVYKVNQKYLQRLDEREQLIDQLLKQKHDFTVAEEYVGDPKLLQFAADDKEVADRWRKRIKFDLLTLKSEKVDEVAAVERLTKRYRSLAANRRQITEDQLLEMFVGSFAAAFDPSSSYASATTSANAASQAGTNLEGIGAMLILEDGDLKVTRIVAGSAAEKHGKLSVGDHVVSVGEGENGELIDIREKTLNDAIKLIRGAAGTVVRLGVIPRKSGQPTVYNITRAKIEVKDSSARGVVWEEAKKANGAPYKIGYIKVPGIYVDTEAQRQGKADARSCTRDVRALLSDFKMQKVDVVILDVRNVFFGNLNETISLTGLFITEGPIVQVKDSSGRVQHHDDLDRTAEWPGPVVLLSNKYSSGTSEILLGAVQDYGRGLVVGDDRTSGQGGISSTLDLGQTMFRVANTPNLGVLTVTTQQFYRPSGVTTFNRGVIPDVTLPSYSNFNARLNEGDGNRALKADAVPAAKFTTLSQVSAAIVAKLKSASEERRNASSEFATLLRNSEQFRPASERPAVSLVEQTFLADLARRAEAADVAAEAERVAPDEIVPRDFYLNEVLAIATDYASLLQSPSAPLPVHTPGKMLTAEEKAAAERAAAAQREQATAEQKAAQDKAEGWRVWTSTAGTKTEAKFKGMVDQKVKLEKRDGTTVSVPAKLLSEDDMNWIRKKR